MHETPQWFVVRTKPRREDYAQGQLARRGVDTFMPRILEHSREGTAPLIGPLFPGYVFVWIRLASQYTSVIWAPGVRSFVAFGEIPSPVDDEVIEFIRERCGSEGIALAAPDFHDGDHVRVTRGPLGGLLGVVQGHVNGRRRVQVLMELLKRRTQVTVPVDLLEHASGL